jgi:hypothetical protein
MRCGFTLSLEILQTGLPQVGRERARWRGGRGKEVRIGEVEEEESALGLPLRELGGMRRRRRGAWPISPVEEARGNAR